MGYAMASNLARGRDGRPRVQPLARASTAGSTAARITITAKPPPAGGKASVKTRQPRNRRPSQPP